MGQGATEFEFRSTALVLSSVDCASGVLIEVEEAMRRIALATSATLASLVVGSLVPTAEAMAVTTPANSAHALKDTGLIQDVACRKVYRCGPYGCDWRAVCWADPHSYPGTYYYGYDAPFDYGYGGFYYYYGGVPLRWTRPPIEATGRAQRNH